MTKHLLCDSFNQSRCLWIHKTELFTLHTFGHNVDLFVLYFLVAFKWRQYKLKWAMSLFFSEFLNFLKHLCSLSGPFISLPQVKIIFMYRIEGTNIQNFLSTHHSKVDLKFQRMNFPEMTQNWEQMSSNDVNARSKYGSWSFFLCKHCFTYITYVLAKRLHDEFSISTVGTSICLQTHGCYSVNLLFLVLFLHLFAIWRFIFVHTFYD